MEASYRRNYETSFRNRYGIYIRFKKEFNQFLLIWFVVSLLLYTSKIIFIGSDYFDTNGFQASSSFLVGILLFLILDRRNRFILTKEYALSIYKKDLIFCIKHFYDIEFHESFESELDKCISSQDWRDKKGYFDSNKKIENITILMGSDKKDGCSYYLNGWFHNSITSQFLVEKDHCGGCVEDPRDISADGYYDKTITTSKY